MSKLTIEQLAILRKRGQPIIEYFGPEEPINPEVRRIRLTGRTIGTAKGDAVENANAGTERLCAECRKGRE